MESVVSTPTPEAVSNVLDALPYRQFLFASDVHVSRPPDLQFAIDEKQQVALAQLADTRGATVPERVTRIPTRTHATWRICEGEHVVCTKATTQKSQSQGPRWRRGLYMRLRSRQVRLERGADDHCASAKLPAHRPPDRLCRGVVQRVPDGAARFAVSSRAAVCNGQMIKGLADGRDGKQPRPIASGLRRVVISWVTARRQQRADCGDC